MYVLIKHISSGNVCFINNTKTQLHSHYIMESLNMTENLVTFEDFERYYTFEEVFVTHFDHITQGLISKEVPFVTAELFVKCHTLSINTSLISNTQFQEQIKIQECSLNFSSFMYVLSCFLIDIQEFCNLNAIQNADKKCCILWNQIYCNSFRENISTLQHSLQCVFFNNKKLLKKCSNWLDNLIRLMHSKYKSNQGPDKFISNFCYIDDIDIHMKTKCVLFFNEHHHSNSIMNIEKIKGTVCIIKNIQRIDQDHFVVNYEYVSY